MGYGQHIRKQRSILTKKQLLRKVLIWQLVMAVYILVGAVFELPIWVDGLALAATMVTVYISIMTISRGY